MPGRRSIYPLGGRRTPLNGRPFVHPVPAGLKSPRVPNGVPRPRPGVNRGATGVLGSARELGRDVRRMAAVEAQPQRPGLGLAGAARTGWSRARGGFRTRSASRSSAAPTRPCDWPCQGLDLLVVHVEGHLHDPPAGHGRRHRAGGGAAAGPLSLALPGCTRAGLTAICGGWLGRRPAVWAGVSGGVVVPGGTSVVEC